MARARSRRCWKCAWTRWGADVLKRNSLAFAAALLISGCSWVGDWFASPTPAVKPAELAEFKQMASLTRMWEAQIGSAGRYTFSPAADSTSLYVASADGRILKLDLANGRELWRVETGQAFSGGLGVGEGLILAGTAKGELFAYKVADGSPAWNAKLSGEILTPPVAADGVVAARGNDGKLWLLEATTGKVRWMQGRNLPALTLREQAYLQLTPRALYAGHAGGRLSAYALNNGAPIWEGNVALPKGATELERISDVTGPAALDDQRICAAGYQGRIACFDRISGNGLWARDLSSLRGLDLDDRFVFAASDRGTVLAFTKDRGANSWKQDKLRDRKLSTPLAVAGKYVAVGDYQGYIHLLSANEGAFAARASTDGSPINGVMIPLKSGLVVQTANGGVYAFKISQ